MSTLIVTGGSVDIEFLRSTIECEPFDRIIAVDHGAEALDALEMLPDTIVGDLDSVAPEIIQKYCFLGAKLIKYDTQKDKTDTHLALEEALEEERSSITIIGAIGTRLDHMLANFQIMMLALEYGVSCYILNKKNKVFLINKTAVFTREHYDFVSLIPMTEVVRGVHTEGLKYPLTAYDLKQGMSIGVSNEWVDKIGRVTIKDGLLLVILSKD